MYRYVRGAETPTQRVWPAPLTLSRATPRHAEAAGEAKRWTRGHIGDGAAASPTAPNGMADQAAGDDETGAGGIDDGG